MSSQNETLPSSRSTTGRRRQKRGRSQNDEDDKKQTLLKKMSLHPGIPQHLRRLRLEAIFHPKFENEKSSQTIRKDMLERVQNNEGYLEVTLKHSGSLVLWSGGQRFYSKNSTDNLFTYVAEILLRQHFERAWRTTKEEGIVRYENCSKYAEERRLTLSFEVVTAVLGDHGATPRRDFVMLTAVADRANERFYSTPEIIQLAQRFRLPHNDSWAFTSIQSARSLFRLYDTSRETGMAQDTINALNTAAETHVASMYPHQEFQGEILEGFIIRYISYRNQQSSDEVRSLMNDLAESSNHILQSVPPSLPPSFGVHNNTDGAEPMSVLSVDIRSVFQNVNSDSQAKGDGFASELQSVLSKSGPRRSIIPFPTKMDLPSLTQKLVQSHDVETRRIAELLETVSNLNKPVRYSIIEETIPSEDGEQRRWLCVIHVIHDSSFQLFHRERKAGGMMLYRGFSIEMSGEGDVDVMINNKDGESMEVDSRTTNSGKSDDSLMLKMKLLPYMVRTFICRNNLKIIKQRGPEEFGKVAKRMLERWEISQSGKELWIPFFKGWATYAKSYFENGPDVDSRLPPLTESSYLAHLEHFTNLYQRGNFDEPKKASFCGVVCVVAPSETNATKAAKYIASALEDAEVTHIRNAAQLEARGKVCYAAIPDIRGANKAVWKYLREASECSAMVFFGCSEDEIEVELMDVPGKKRKQFPSMCRGWRKVACALSIDLPKSSISGFEKGEIEVDAPLHSSDFDEALGKIKQLGSTTCGEGDAQSGLLVFFPGIPGCGKSSVLESLKKELESHIPERKIHICVGDKVGKSFWSLMKTTRKKDSSCIFIADKNTPPSSWNNVGDTCSVTSGVPLAVLPDRSVLETTSLKGARKPDGTFADNVSHLYPFSLPFLALCMARVLEREPKSHPGKLDFGTPHACMIVVMFYSLYRHISADTFKDTINLKLDKAGALDALEPIELPVLADAGYILPSDLYDVLVEALQFQVSGKLFNPVLFWLTTKPYPPLKVWL